MGEQLDVAVQQRVEAEQLWKFLLDSFTSSAVISLVTLLLYACGML